MTEFGVVRELSEGIPRIYEEMSKYFLDEPEFEVDSADNFILTLKNNYIARNQRKEENLKKNASVSKNWDELTKIEKLVLQFIADKEGVTTSEIAKHIKRSSSTVRKILVKLREKDLVSWIGTNEFDPKKVYKLK